MFYLNISRTNNEIHSNFSGIIALYDLFASKKVVFSESDLHKINLLKRDEFVLYEKIKIKNVFNDLFYITDIDDTEYSGIWLPYNHIKIFFIQWNLLSKDNWNKLYINYDCLQFQIHCNAEINTQQENYNDKLYYILIKRDSDSYSNSNNEKLFTLTWFLEHESQWYVPIEDLKKVLLTYSQNYETQDFVLLDNKFVKVHYGIPYVTEDYEEELKEQEKTAFILPRRMLWELIEAWNNLGNLSDKKWYRIVLSLDMQQNIFDLRLDENIQQYFV